MSLDKHCEKCGGPLDAEGWHTLEFSQCVDPQLGGSMSLDRQRKEIKQEAIIGLAESLRREHYECVDFYYSCPLSEGEHMNKYNENPVCSCGANDHNARLDQLLALLKQKDEICVRCGGKSEHEHSLRRGESAACPEVQPHDTHIWVMDGFPHPIVCYGIGE